MHVHDARGRTWTVVAALVLIAAHAVLLRGLIGLGLSVAIVGTLIGAVVVKHVWWDRRR